MADIRQFSKGAQRLFRLKHFFVRQRTVITLLLRQSAGAWNADNAPRLSAALAFYTILSLSPLIVIVVGLAGFIFGREAAGGQLVRDIHEFVGWDGTTAIQAIVHSANRHDGGVLAGMLSGIVLLFGASSVMAELRSGLNTVWQVEPESSASEWKTIWQMGKDRIFSFLLVTGAGLLLLLSVVASAWVAWLGHFLGSRSPFPKAWPHAAALFVSDMVITALFAAVYRIIPEVKLEWKDVAVGAAVTALIFTAGKQLIALYLGRAAFVSTYGAAGSIVVLLAWVYYSAQLFFFGAEFTKVFARTLGSHAPSTGRGTQPPPGAGNEVETHQPS